MTSLRQVLRVVRPLLRTRDSGPRPQAPGSVCALIGAVTKESSRHRPPSAMGTRVQSSRNQLAMSSGARSGVPERAWSPDQMEVLIVSISFVGRRGSLWWRCSRRAWRSRRDRAAAARSRGRGGRGPMGPGGPGLALGAAESERRRNAEQVRADQGIAMAEQISRRWRSASARPAERRRQAVETLSCERGAHRFARRQDMAHGAGGCGRQGARLTCGESGRCLTPEQQAQATKLRAERKGAAGGTAAGKSSSAVRIRNRITANGRGASAPLSSPSLRRLPRELALEVGQVPLNTRLPRDSPAFSAAVPPRNSRRPWQSPCRNVQILARQPHESRV